MAQRSKKDHIVASALPLFLENGFKGTSIDMVVKASAVSKPTVYNHFPDKAALMLAVLADWIEKHKPQIVPINDFDRLGEFIRESWLSDDALRLYAIVIGEGFRFPEARSLFWEQYDRHWRAAFGYLCDQSPGLDRDAVERRLEQELLRRLRAQ